MFFSAHTEHAQLVGLTEVEILFSFYAYSIAEFVKDRRGDTLCSKPIILSLLTST